MPRREYGPITPTVVTMLRKVKRRMPLFGAEWPALRRATSWGLLRWKIDITGEKGCERCLTLAGELVLAAFDAGVRSAR